MTLLFKCHMYTPLSGSDCLPRRLSRHVRQTRLRRAHATGLLCSASSLARIMRLIKSAGSAVNRARIMLALLSVVSPRDCLLAASVMKLLIAQDHNRSPRAKVLTEKSGARGDWWRSRDCIYDRNAH